MNDFSVQVKAEVKLQYDLHKFSYCMNPSVSMHHMYASPSLSIHEHIQQVRDAASSVTSVM